MRDDWNRLLDILEQVAFIEEDVALGRAAFDGDRHICDSIALRISMHHADEKLGGCLQAHGHASFVCHGPTNCLMKECWKFNCQARMV